jgi:hypothetical protein
MTWARGPWTSARHDPQCVVGLIDRATKPLAPRQVDQSPAVVDKAVLFRSSTGPDTTGSRRSDHAESTRGSANRAAREGLCRCSKVASPSGFEPFARREPSPLLVVETAMTCEPQPSWRPPRRPLLQCKTRASRSLVRAQWRRSCRAGCRRRPAPRHRRRELSSRCAVSRVCRTLDMMSSNRSARPTAAPTNQALA